MAKNKKRVDRVEKLIKEAGGIVSAGKSEKEGVIFLASVGGNSIGLAEGTGKELISIVAHAIVNNPELRLIFSEGVKIADLYKIVDEDA